MRCTIPNPPDFDLQTAHKYFSASCFNQAWDFIDKPDRTAGEDQEMLLLSLASLWHWTQRKDCTESNLSVAYWQVSRIYALLGKIEDARQYGQRCLDISLGAKLDPFYIAYAYEALARAEAEAHNSMQMHSFLDEAMKLVELVSDPESKKGLLEDLATIN